ncbi:MAG: ImmA/IrrE family metallo-endopeptidase [bacterium]|nr:ImmA/IrrE family metallo-endopeptidase [bacterium]
MINKLQQLVPRRRMNREEALAIAERQAHRLRNLLGVDEAAITTQHLHAIPGVIIEDVAKLGVSGATRKVGDLWIILTNRDEAPVRQRFTMAHEIKHILDDQAVDHLRKTSPEATSPGWLTERICDYFAACLLMPRIWIKRAWTAGTQDEATLAKMFDVSTDAIRIRLQQTGLVDPPRRCHGYTPDVVPLVARTPA